MKFKSLDNYNLSITGKGRLNEVASLLNIAIWRQVRRKDAKLLQKPLDSCSKWSVTAGYNQFRR